MKYEIEIEGLPEDIEPVAYAFPRKGDLIVKAGTDQVSIEGPINYNFIERRLIVRRKTRKYDWNKTLDDVLVKNGNGKLMRLGDCAHPTKWLSDLWQPNIHGKCPVDKEASIVRILGGSEKGDLASMMDWKLVEAWQFIRLADSYEW